MSTDKNDKNNSGKPKVDDYMSVNYAEELGNLLPANGQTIAIAESCTGGLLGSTITDVPGSSLYFLGGMVAYSDTIKLELLGVPLGTIKKHGAVSEKTSLIMASMITDHFVSDVGIAITGIMGPSGGSPDKPVGTVFIAVASEDDETDKEFNFNGTREEIKAASVKAALKMAVNFLKE